MEAEGAYFDGLRPIRQRAELKLDGRALLLSVDAGPVFGWDYDAIRLEGDDGATLRLHREQSGAAAPP
jgi:hypothetical protein